MVNVDFLNAEHARALDGQASALTIAVAFCWASGEIEIEDESEDFELPEGVIVIARGESYTLRHLVNVRARHGHNGVHLVPGLPELDSDEEDAVEILVNWRSWAFATWTMIDGVRTQPEILDLSHSEGRA